MGSPPAKRSFQLAVPPRAPRRQGPSLARRPGLRRRPLTRSSPSESKGTPLAPGARHHLSRSVTKVRFQDHRCMTLLAPPEWRGSAVRQRARGSRDAGQPERRPICRQPLRHARTPHQLSTSTTRDRSSTSVQSIPSTATPSPIDLPAPPATATCQESKQTCASAASTVWP